MARDGNLFDRDGDLGIGTFFGGGGPKKVSFMVHVELDVIKHISEKSYQELGNRDLETQVRRPVPD